MNKVVDTVLQSIHYFISFHFGGVVFNLKSASNLNGNLNCSKELEHYAS